MGGGESHSGVDWEEVKIEGDEEPGGRFGSSMEILMDEDKLVLIGGDNRFSEFFIFEFGSRSWKRKKAPFGLSDQSSCVIRSPKKNATMIYIYGGKRKGVGKISSDVYECIVTKKKDLKWKSCKTKGKKKPKPRYGHTCVSSPDQLGIFVFGGITSDGEGSNELWKLSLKNKKWERIETPEANIKPSPRAFHSSVCLENRMYVFHGTNGENSVLNDFFSFSFIDNTWTKLSYKNQNSIIPRFRHQMITIKSGESEDIRVILGPGQYSKHHELSKVSVEEWTSFYELDVKKRSWRLIPWKHQNKILWGYSMLYHPKTHKIYLYGGKYVELTKENRNSFFKDLVEYENKKERWLEENSKLICISL